MATMDQMKAEQRRLRVIALAIGSDTAMAQYRASRVSWERGAPAIPGAHVRAEAEARRQRA